MLATTAPHHESDMDSTRISIARVLELGVQVSWREAAAIVHEAMALTGPTKGPRPARVEPRSCIITRGGDVALVDDADQARPETVVQLLQDLLAACPSPGGLGPAFANGTALSFLEDLSLQVTFKRRRVEIASVALRGLAAEADHQRAESERASAGVAVHDIGSDPGAEPDLPIEVPADVPYDLMPHPDPVMRGGRVPTAGLEERDTAYRGDVSTPVRPWPAPEQRTYTRASPLTRARPRVATAATVPLDEFAQLRATTLRAATRARSFDIAAMARPIAVILGVVTGAAAATAAGLAALTWVTASADPDRPAGPRLAIPQAIGAIPLMVRWADIGERPTPEPPPPAAVPVTRREAPAPSTPSAVRPGTVDRPPAPPGAPIQSVVPAAAPNVPAPSAAANSAAVVREPDIAPAAPATTRSTTETLYSWTSPGVEPPVLQYPAMSSTALRSPDAVIDGPYFEVLVDPEGNVETVRIRGRIEPGETFYRHRMMLAAAKLWRFSPARLNGRPVRYVTRVVIDNP